MCRADNSNVRPGIAGAPVRSGTAIVTPCWTSKFAIVATSARSGRLPSTSDSAVNRLAVISGSAAFLAPPIGIVPDKGTPPRIRILSIVSRLQTPGVGDDVPGHVTRNSACPCQRLLLLERTAPLKPAGRDPSG